MSLIKIVDITKNIENTKNKNHIKSTQFYSNKFIFFKYCNTEKFTNTFFDSKFLEDRDEDKDKDKKLVDIPTMPH